MKKFQSEELEDRYQHNQPFRDKVDQQEKQYLELVKKAQTKSLSIHEEILERFLKEGDEAVYFLYGYLQPPPGTKTADLTLAFIKYFQPEPKQKFVLIYFNHETPSSDYYFEFKKILQLIPYRILQNLRQFILVKPYFYIKAFDYVGLGNISRLFSNRYLTVDSCQELIDHLKIPVNDFVTFVPEEISAEFPRTFKKRPSLVSYRINLEGQNMTEEQRHQKNQFQLSIKALITKEVYKLQNYEVGDIGIPIIIQLLIHYFRTKPQGLDQEGIFRKSVSIDEENQTLNELSKRNYEYLEKIKNPFLIASLIKRFFSNLKEPIILFKTYEQLIHDQGVKDKKQNIKTHIRALPKVNFMTLAFLIDFLKKDVLPHQKYSKMSANNLAICFNPSLMRSEKVTMADLINASKGVTITNTLISDFQYIFGNQEQLRKMFKNNFKSITKGFNQALTKELELQSSNDILYNSIDSYSVEVLEPRPSMEKQCQSFYQAKPSVNSFAQKRPLNVEKQMAQLSKKASEASQRSIKSAQFEISETKSKASNKDKEEVLSNQSSPNKRKLQAPSTFYISDTKSCGERQQYRQDPPSQKGQSLLAPTTIRFSYSSSKKQIKEGL